MTTITRIIISIFLSIANIAMAQIISQNDLQNLESEVSSDSLFYEVKRYAMCNDKDSTVLSVDNIKTTNSVYSVFQFDPDPSGAFAAYRMTSLQFIYASPVYPGIIYNAGNLTILGSMSFNNYPGMMNKDSGCFGVSFGNDKMNFYIGGVVNKYGFYGGLLSQLGVHGRFTYHLSSPLSLTVFTYYYGKNNMPVMPNGSYMPPSMLGYYDVSRFGGYLNFRPSERFGIQVGGQVVERMGVRNHYEVEPITTPYINVGKGKRKIGIGLPVGQILNGLLGK